MEACERNSCVYVTIATSDAVTGEEQLESLNVKGQKTVKVIDRYAVAMKKRNNCWRFATKNILSL